ncbi:hypothetical protein MHM84_19235 [Halomonas sp. McH1-25]|uniref:hypothetical protein n=1 Tax=unclassified Halomonas TaxID=2609666 RepID=UPI001EF5E912|nr:MULTISPECIES: hypothetical protein [unclassified Halomonas]MCG7601883.1 hypothetical protein [Halomonas sp. McH1-25]MCP1344146.1 hypothetical protein [Halomonas sp. FL8]MCP1362694.1 hypothetical protein [Halomonas sp. BBD45]MCP1364491.1 hypothetical protein [Halomonas sp. BBD48]
MQRLSLDTGILRVRDLDAMKAFCIDMLRLPVLLETATSVTFELGTDARGQTQVFMLLSDDHADAPRRLTLEVSDQEFSPLCEHLRQRGAHLFQSEDSSAPGCAWRILSCNAPEGHRLIVVGIDPTRCAPTSALSPAVSRP